MDPDRAKPEPPTVSVVVCTYSLDRWPVLVDCLDSVERAVRHDEAATSGAEVVVVVDHNPELEHRVAERYPSCTVVANVHAQGLSGARNTGIETAGGDVVLFLDDDAAVAEGWVAAHRAAFADPTVIGTAGVVEPAWERGAPPRWWPHEFDWVVGCTYTGAVVDGSPVRNPIGANMGFRRAAMVDAGGFSSDLGRIGTVPVGCEETELSIRVTAAHPGSVIVSVPGAVCRHLVPASRATWHYFWRRCLAEGRSKAVVAAFAGANAATSSERAYTTRTLPRAVARAVRHGELRRAGAVMAGLVTTAAGFAAGTAGRITRGGLRRGSVRPGSRSARGS